jgi:hypothetical protein
MSDDGSLRGKNAAQLQPRALHKLGWQRKLWPMPGGLG